MEHSIRIEEHPIVVHEFLDPQHQLSIKIKRVFVSHGARCLLWCFIDSPALRYVRPPHHAFRHTFRTWWYLVLLWSTPSLYIDKIPTLVRKCSLCPSHRPTTKVEWVFDSCDFISFDVAYTICAHANLTLIIGPKSLLDTLYVSRGVARWTSLRESEILVIRILVSRSHCGNNVRVSQKVLTDVGTMW